MSNDETFIDRVAHPKPRSTFAEVEAVFQKWIRDRDPVPTRAVLSTYVANRHLDGDPVWSMLVGGSGVGKTERLVPLAVMDDVLLESSISGPAALLSGTAKKERAKHATGGLLRKVPDRGGVLLLKDFTSIIDMHRDARAEVLAALREIYDGRWDRSIGSDGGQTLSWCGRLGLIAGCTTAIDAAHAVISTMGTRFVLIRLHGDRERAPDHADDRDDDSLAGSAFDHVGTETRMRTELRQAVHRLLTHLPGRAYDKADIRQSVIALSQYVALARSPVDRDHRSEIRLVLDPEAPTRIVKMLTQLWRAAGLLGIDREDAWAMVRRVGFDSIPKLRRAVLDYLDTCVAPAETSEIAEVVDHPTNTTRRALEDLNAHKVITKTMGGRGTADRWSLSDRARLWLDAAATLPALSDGLSASSLYKRKSTHDDIAGKVPANKNGAKLRSRTGRDERL